MQSHTFIPNGLLHDAIPLEALKMHQPKGVIPPHLTVGSDTYIDITSKTMNNDKYPWLDKHYRK